MGVERMSVPSASSEPTSDVEVDGAHSEPTGSARPLKFLGIVVANGMSSEVMVMSRLLRGAPSVDACVIVHDDGETPARVADESGATVVPLDLGWRHGHDRNRLGRVTRLSGQIARASLALPRVVATAWRERPDVVYSSQQKWDCLFARIVALVIRRPQVVHLHSIPGPWLGRRVLRLLRTCDLVVAVSGFICRHAIAAGTEPSRTVAIVNPIDAADPPDEIPEREVLGLDPAGVAFGFVSRIVPGKGHEETLRALARLDPGVRGRCSLAIVGDGPDREIFESLAAELGLNDRVRFLGQRDDVPSLLAAFDVFVHPSYDDACPLAVLEALAAGLPVVAFDEGGLGEIVADGRTGVLVAGGDVDALSAAMARLIEHPELRRSMGEAARRHVELEFEPAVGGRSFAEALSRLARQG